MPPTTSSRAGFSGVSGRAPGAGEAGLFKLWLDHTPDGVLCTDAAGRIIYGNACICQLLGYTEQEFCRLDITDTYDPAETHVANVRLRAANIGETNICERRMRRKDGTFVPVEIRFVRLPGGTLVGVARDITVRKHREQRMLAQLAVTRVLGEATSLAEAAPVLVQAMGECIGWDYCAMWELDSAMRVLRCSAVWERQPSRTEWFATASKERTFARGQGMIGRVALTESPLWLTDVTRDASFPRASLAAHDGLHTALAYPVRGSARLLAVIEFLSHDVREVDETAMETLRGLTGQIARFAEGRPTGSLA